MDDLDYADLEQRVLGAGGSRIGELIEKRKQALARGDNDVDVITAEAARFFNVDVTDVTQAQRQRMKSKMLYQLYRTQAPSRLT